MGFHRLTDIYPNTIAPSNEMADPKYKNKSKTEDGETVYEYSDKQVQHRNREKAKRVEKLDKSIGDLRKKVKEDLKASDVATRLKALAVGLIDETYGRVGNEKSAKEGHYGVTVWKKEHVSFSGNSATVKYVGKSGVKQEKSVTDAALVKALKDAVEGKSKDDFVFDCTDDDKNTTCVRAKDVNEYLKPFDITAKDLRGYHANKLMQDALKKLRSDGKKLPEDKKEREKLLKEEFQKALELVADDVGHEAATLKSNYLVPALEDTYLKDGTVIKKLDKKKSASVIARDVRLATLVAKRFANTFQAPPAFLDDILAFFTEKYAGHILARTERRISELQERGKRIDYRKFLDSLQKNYSDVARNLFTMDAIEKSLDQDISEFLQLYPSGEGVQLTLSEGMVTYQYTDASGRGKGRAYGPYKVRKASGKLIDAVNKAYDEVKRMNQSDSFESGDTALVDLIRLRKRLFKITTKAKEYKSKATFSTKVDVTGWKYLDPMTDFPSAQVLLNMEWGEIQIVLHFKGHISRGGVWYGYPKLMLEVDMTADAQTVEQFEDNLFEIRGTARHEAQHVGQDALALIRDLREDAGLPSERSEGYNPSGVRTKNPSSPRQDHALRDVEFHTRLQDEIEWAVRQLGKVQRGDRKEVLKVWTGQNADLSLLEKYDGAFSRPREFFQSLKRKQPDKWKEAMRDYVSGVGNQIAF